VQPRDPFVAANMPAGHVRHAVLSMLGPYVSAGQMSHELAAVAFEYHPRPQPKHADEPLTGANVPGEHVKQLVVPVYDDDPMPHAWHSLAALAVEYRPLGHCSHTLAPLLAAYRPGVHCAHVDRPACVAANPMLHAAQLELAVAAAYVPGAHGEQRVCALAAEYAPVAHDTHADMPVALAYEPAAHD